MATFTGKQYGQMALHLARKRVDWVSDNIYIQLHTSSYTPDQDVHDFQNDLANEHAATGGYTTGGFLLDNKTATYDGSSNTTKLDADDEVVSSSTLTWRTAVIVDESPGTAATNPLLGYNQGDADTISTGGATNINFAAAGVFTFVAA